MSSTRFKGVKKYCVLHIQKGKGSASGLSYHINRTEGMEHMYKNADPSARHLNRNYGLPIHKKCSPGTSIDKMIDQVIQENTTSNRKIRKDAVKFCSVILSGSHDYMNKLSNAKEFEEWEKANKEFIVEEFGAKNVVSLSLHMDELTPHFHVVFVPIVKDKKTGESKLSAKEKIGGKRDLQALQDRYHAKMSHLGFDRGVRGSKATHTTTKQFYAALSDSNNISLLIRQDKALKAVETAKKDLSKNEMLNRGLKEQYRLNVEQLNKQDNKILTKEQEYAQLINMVDKKKRELQILEQKLRPKKGGGRGM